MSSGCWQKRGNFYSFPLNFYISLYINKKLKTHLKILKSLSGSSPNYFLSHHTTFRKTQSGATVPLTLYRDKGGGESSVAFREEKAVQYSDANIFIISQLDIKFKHRRRQNRVVSRHI